MNQIKVFESTEFGKVRTVQIGGEPYFVGKDVAEILGYAKPENAIATHVDEDDTLKQGVTDSIGRTQQTTVINESGLYSLILSSKLPRAKEFKRWVTSEVLPAVRKHGAYMTPAVIEETLLDPDYIIQLATTLKREREKNKELENKIETDKPKVIFADGVAASKSSILVGDLAKLIKQNGYPIGQKRLFEYLRDNGYLMKSGNSRNMPTQRSMEMGLFEVKISSVVNPDGSVRETKTTKVTGKGQIYFVNKFAKL